MALERARRVAPGIYRYRGYEIEEVGRYDDVPCVRWNIRHLDEDSAHDAANTLRDAKALIDHWAS